MNQIVKIVSAILSFICFSATLSAQNQETTEENYLRRDSLLWMQYERDIERLMKEHNEHSSQKDSLQRVYNDIYELVSVKNRELAIEYAATPSGLRRLFMVRLDIPKDSLRLILDALPGKMRSSEYGKNLFAHLDSRQTEEGDRCYDFEATTDLGSEFLMSSLVGKNILFLYGGLDCMGTDGRKYLNALYEKSGGDDFEIVVYCPVSELEELEKVRETHPCNFLLVSDFLQDSSPVKILYGTQATPTCFFVDHEGVVQMKTEGLYTDRIDELMNI